MRLQEKEVVEVVRRLRLRELRAWVRAGWVRPKRGNDGLLFDDMDVARLRLICDLKKDIGITGGAIPTVLSLLDQLHGLRSELRALASAIEQQPTATRRAVLEAYRKLSENRRTGKRATE
ncbi:MerR family transcriptional regulator [Cribrihabitans pelagius]|uniref:MerR family transcriptional regulator n=1 Tax=Cribrihabitans pelagius TaxID=1765746 RepID=UPI003B58CB88